MRPVFTLVNIYFKRVVDKAKRRVYSAAMEDSKIIDSLGGTNKVAAMCGLHKSSVSQWRNRGIPDAWRMYLQKIRPAAFKRNKVEA